jgi:hypothetical protein
MPSTSEVGSLFERVSLTGWAPASRPASLRLESLAMADDLRSTLPDELVDELAGGTGDGGRADLSPGGAQSRWGFTAKRHGGVLENPPQWGKSSTRRVAV